MEKQAFKFSEEGAINYDKYLGPFIFEPYAINLTSRLETKNVESVLEIASGTGRVTNHLRERLPASVKLVATDISADMLEIAKKRISNNNVDFKVADALDLPFADNSFDYVVCQFGFMFLSNKQQGFDEAYRVLKPGGKLIFSTWDSTENVSVFKIIFNDVLLPFFNLADPARFLVPFSLHNPGQLKAFMEQAKFKNANVEKVVLVGRTPSAKEIVNGFLLKHSLGREVTEKDPAALNQLAEKMEQRLVAAFGRGEVTCPLSAFTGMGEK